MELFKKEIIDFLKKETKLKEISLDVPPDPVMGDYAFPCFVLAKNKQNPSDIAEKLKEKVPLKGMIKDARVVGPYLNFFVNEGKITENTLKQIYREKEKYGSAKAKKIKYMIEYPSPNTNKPLHLGHIRNILIGQSLSNIFEFLGNKVIHVNLNNDRGIHICKSMLAYKKWGKNKKPNKKPDHFVGDFYVLYNKKENEKLKQELQDMLKKWEDGDKTVRELWKKINTWALKGFDETYKKFNLKFDKTYNESEIYDKGKDIVLDGLKKGIFYKDKDNSIAVDLKDLGKKVLIRPDGTSIYITQDIYLALLKFRDYNPDKSIYVVGSEQNYHFEVLFKILEMLKFKFAKKCFHLSYGMVYLPEGKMKSREGNVVDTDNFIDEMIALAKEEVRKRDKDLTKKKVDNRSTKVGMGALKFFILKTDVSKDIFFDPKKSISFEGETGPYIQYAHARICSILRKYNKSVSDKINFSILKEKEEVEIIKKLGGFPEVIEKAGDSFKPSIVSNYIHSVAKGFNEFYHKHNILKEEEELKKARLLMAYCVKEVLENGLRLLGIEAPERM